MSDVDFYLGVIKSIFLDCSNLVSASNSSSKVIPDPSATEYNRSCHESLNNGESNEIPSALHAQKKRVKFYTVKYMLNFCFILFYFHIFFS